MPFRRFAANQAWLELVLAGADLLAWLRAVALDGAGSVLTVIGFVLLIGTSLSALGLWLCHGSC